MILGLSACILHLPSGIAPSQGRRNNSHIWGIVGFYDTVNCYIRQIVVVHLSELCPARWPIEDRFSRRSPDVSLNSLHPLKEDESIILPPFRSNLFLGRGLGTFTVPCTVQTSPPTMRAICIWATYHFLI